MRRLVALFFVLSLSVGPLFAQNKKSDQQKQDSVSSTVKTQGVNAQLLQNKTENKNVAGTPQFKMVGNGDAGNGTATVSTLTPKNNSNLGYTNIYSYLQGMVPGVDVEGTNIYVRGTASLYGGSTPLIILDGVELNGTMGLGDVNPANIQSVEVLKGPSASIYGTKGSNGVIIITRKH